MPLLWLWLKNIKFQTESRGGLHNMPDYHIDTMTKGLIQYLACAEKGYVFCITAIIKTALLSF